MSPLDNQNPLQNLHGIMAPADASAWPPAPIYWFLMLLSTALLFSFIYLLNKFLKKQKRQSIQLKQLQVLADSKANFVDLNQLLKGVALLHFEREQVASLHGADWFDFLQEYSADTIFNDKQQFINRLYKLQATACSENDIKQAKLWIIGLNKQIKKTTKRVNK